MPDIERELKHYFDMPKPDAKVNILQWWQSVRHTLPILAKVARGVLCIPAASSSSERVFSASGSIVSDKRHNLATSTTKKLTLIKCNYDYIRPYMRIMLEQDEEYKQAQAEAPKKPETPKPSTSKQQKLKFTKVMRLPTASPSASSSSTSPTPASSSSESTPPQKSRACLPPGVIVIDSTTDEEVPVVGKGKGKGKRSAPEKRKIPFDDSDTEEMLDKDNQVTKIKKRKVLTPQQIKQSLDMFLDNDDDLDDPDFDVNKN